MKLLPLSNFLENKDEIGMFKVVPRCVVESHVVHMNAINEFLHFFLHEELIEEYGVII
jgi:hypothetical protein